jgi:DNA end-binding protein Ku
MARAIWNGSISFGLVTIPVRVYSAIHEHDVHFHQVTERGARVHYQRVTENGRKVDYSDIKKGYELAKGKIVVIEPEELAAIAPRTTRTIDIESFVPLEEIDPIYFERTYHLAPADDAAARAYALLASVMAHKQRVGIGKVVMRDKQYLAAVRPYGKALAMSTMLFADEVVPPSAIDDVPTRTRSVGGREKKMADQIVDSLAAHWDPKRYTDDYQEQVRKLVQAKAKGKIIEAPEEPEEAKVLDLVEALQASLDNAHGKSKPKKKPAARRSAHRRAS